MKNFMLDSNAIAEKTEKAYSTTNSIIQSLRELEKICEAAYEEINDHDELENVYYESFRNDIEYLDEYRMKYQKFGGTLSGYTGYGGTKLIPNSYGGYSNTNTYSGYMGYNLYGGDTQSEGIMDEYKSEADYNFYRAKESLLERLSNTNLEDITVDNNLGICSKSPSSIFTPGIQVETSNVKDKIGIKDLLGYGKIEESLKKQYEESKALIDEYNDSLDDYNPADYPDGMPEFLKKLCYNLIKDEKQSIDSYDDYVEAIVTAGDFNFETNTEKAVSLGLYFIPFLGEARMAVEALTGENLVTGEKLNNLERILSIIPLGASSVAKITEKTALKEVNVGTEAAIEGTNGVVLGMNGAGHGEGLLDSIAAKIGKGTEVTEGGTQAERLKYYEKLEDGVIDDTAWEYLKRYANQNDIKLSSIPRDEQASMVNKYKQQILDDLDLMKIIEEKSKKLLGLSDVRLTELMDNGYNSKDYYSILNTDKSNRTADQYLKTIENTKVYNEWNEVFCGNDNKFVISYMPKDAYDNFVLGYGTIGRGGSKGGQFVLPQSIGESIESKLINKGSITNATNEFKSELARELGLPTNVFESGVIKVEIPLVDNIDLKMVMGIEDGCNYQWIPGGKTLGGTPEGIIRQITSIDDKELFESIIKRINKKSE